MRDLSEDPGLLAMYTAKELKGPKSKWLVWWLEDIAAFASPSPVTIPVKKALNNRPFYLSRSHLVEPPELKGDLHCTAQFFIDSLPDGMKKNVMKLGQALRGKSVRVGTTCSGSDVCLPCLQSVFDIISGEARAVEIT